MDIISTKGVAEVLGVSEATVKRWADAGMLRCFRTRGGHRKFRLRDVRAFLNDEQQVVAAPAPVAPPSTELSDEQREVRALALAGDVDGLVSLVANQHLRGVRLATTFDATIGPALNDIGEGWARGAVSVAQEHLASNAISEMLARVRPLVESRSRPDRGRALCACVGDEHHDIAVRMVALILAEQGYRTSMVGANVPTGDLALMMAGERPALLALSASIGANPETLRGDIAVLSSAGTATRTRIIVGGKGFAQLATLPGAIRRHDRLEELLAPRTASDTGATASP
jgi:excisionase family DNA binding protein